MIRELRFFMRLCRDKSIRKASQALFITPQGLSKAMKSLETELGVQLFTRSNEGIEPTEAGRLVAKKARLIVEAYENMRLELGAFTDGASNQLKITVASGVIHALQPDFLYEYHCAYPEVELMVGEYPDLAGEQAMLDGEAEVGISVGPADKRHFASSRLREGWVSVIVHKSHPLAMQRSISFKDVTKVKWVIPNEKYKAHRAVLAKCAELGVKPQVSMLAADVGIIFKFCHLNSGIGFATEWALAESGYDSLKSVPLAEDSACCWDICLINRKRASLSPTARGFIEHVRNWFAAEE